jgi:hypothetical protein
VIGTVLQDAIDPHVPTEALADPRVRQEVVVVAAFAVQPVGSAPGGCAEPRAGSASVNLLGGISPLRVAFSC